MTIISLTSTKWSIAATPTPAEWSTYIPMAASIYVETMFLIWMSFIPHGGVDLCWDDVLDLDELHLGGVDLCWDDVLDLDELHLGGVDLC